MRDQAVVAVVADLRLVTGAQLRRLFFAGNQASSQSARVARRSFERLVVNKYLWRAERRIGGLHAGSSGYVYAPGARAQAGSRRGQRAEPSLLFLRHALAVAELYVQLHEQLGAGRLAELVIRTEPTCWRQISDGSGSTLKPDLHVVSAIETTEQLAFIEVDNGTEHRSAIERKAGLYQAHWATGAEQATEGVYPLVLRQVTDDRRRAELSAWLDRTPSRRLHRVMTPDQVIAHFTN